MDFYEIKDRIVLLHGRNKSLISDIKKEFPDWEHRKEIKSTIEHLEIASSELYLSSLGIGDL